MAFGYDPWAGQLAATNLGADQAVLTVDDLVGAGFQAWQVNQRNALQQALAREVGK